MMQKILGVCVAILTLLVVILAFQNLTPVKLQVLFRSVNVSPSLLIALAWLVGACTGRPLGRLLLRVLRGPKPQSSSSASLGP